jgi:hypothetical protein
MSPFCKPFTISTTTTAIKTALMSRPAEKLNISNAGISDQRLPRSNEAFTIMVVNTTSIANRNKIYVVPNKILDMITPSYICALSFLSR